MNNESMTILDAGEEAIQRYLKATGKTREQLELDIAERKKKLADPNNKIFETKKGANPALRKKFTMPIGADFPGDKK